MSKAEQDRLHALADDQAENVAGLRAERHAHADFAGALLDRVSDRAVDADGREEQRDGREDAEQRHHQASPGRALAP